MKADLYGESPLEYSDTSEGIGVIKKIGERLVEFKA
jgi:hypothetical protein